MIRLALCGDETFDRAVRSRLRGAEIALPRFEATSWTFPENCDAVLLIEPGCNVAEEIAHCLSAGKHVLLTPEAWLTRDVLAALLVLARQAGRQFAIANPDRFLPSRRLIRDQLDAGKLGQPGLVRSHLWSTQGAGHEPSAIPTCLLREIDVALWLMGSPPSIVYAVEPVSGESDAALGRVVQLHLGFPSGGMALIGYTNRLPAGEGYRSLSLLGAAGAAYADEQQNMQLLFRGGPPQASRVDEGTKHWLGLTQTFVDGLATGRDFSSSATAWQDALLVADAMRRSLASRQSITQEGR